MKYWIYLFIAILSEVIGTMSLQHSVAFTKLLPSIIVIIGYTISFYTLALSLHYINVGVAYAIWSGIGLLLIVILDYILNKQSYDIASMIGILFIILGIAIMNLYSDTLTH